MAREIISSWGDYQTALSRLLAMAKQKIFIYDEDLGRLNLESPARLAELKRALLAQHNSETLRIAVRNDLPLRQNPLLMRLLADFNHRFSAIQTAPQLAHLRDGMILIDDQHALIRFERDQPRSKLLIDEPDEIRPYLLRFNEIWNEGGAPISPSTLGL